LRGGADDGGESNYNGLDDVVRGPSVGGMGRRTLIIGPHAAAAVVDDDDRSRGGGASCPPLSGLSSPNLRRSLSLMLPTTVGGGGWRAFGTCVEAEAKTILS
jgi:hypothetical protein